MGRQPSFRWRIVLIVASLGIGALLVVAVVPGLRHRAIRLALGGDMAHRTIDERLAEFGAAADARLAPHFSAVHAAYPPAAVLLVAVKDERRLDCYIDQAGWRFLRSWPILAASGGPGPKLRQGDQQVPEGVYAIESLNPNSAYHVSLRLDYPNADDRARAAADRRDQPGSDIMIHGKAVSVGCLAMGDEAAEELFTLAARAGLPRIGVLIVPTDLRRNPPPALAVPWADDLYRKQAGALAAVPPPPARDP